MSDLQIRTMTEDDLAFAFECTSSEGWQGETIETFRALLRHDPRGCFIAESSGTRIGICIATKYRNNGFIGELVVIKEMRGIGAGRALFDHSISYLQEQNLKNIFLDGDIGAVHIYKKSGFRKVCRSLRFNGQIKGEPGGSVKVAVPGDLEAVCNIDEQLFGDDRSFFLKYRYSMFPELLHVAEVKGEICGYIQAQPGNGVLSVGPWAVINRAISPLVLLKSLSHHVGDVTMRIGVLEANTDAVELMRSVSSFEEREYSWRMVLGQSENLGTSKSLYATGSAAKG